MGHYIFLLWGLSGKTPQIHKEVTGRQKGGGLGAETEFRQCSVTPALWDPTLGSLRFFTWPLSSSITVSTEASLPAPSQPRWTEWVSPEQAFFVKGRVLWVVSFSYVNVARQHPLPGRRPSVAWQSYLFRRPLRNAGLESGQQGGGILPLKLGVFGEERVWDPLPLPPTCSSGSDWGLTKIYLKFTSSPGKLLPSDRTWVNL